MPWIEEKRQIEHIAKTHLVETFDMQREIDKLKKELKAKEQECEELKDLANHNGRVCNERLDKIDELEHNINELNEQLEAYKMEAEEGKEINAELKAELTRANCQIADDEILQCDMREAIEGLKAENYELKVMFKDLSYENQKFSYQIEEQAKQLEPFKDEYFKGLETTVIAELAKKSIRITAENRKLEQTLTEIKNKLTVHKTLYYESKLIEKLHKQILQKISECEGNDDSSNR